MIKEETLKGEKYSFTGEDARCSNCGAEVYVPEIEDRNLEALYNEYRHRNNIISLERIRAIPDKYDIRKRPLSLVLGWREITFSRYYDGALPTKQYSDVLQKVYEEPGYYHTLLEKNKGNLQSLAAYEKSKKKIAKLLDFKYKEGGKLKSISQYLVHECEDITSLALQRILYYVQGFHYAFYGQFLFDADCEAWAHGPVYKDVYDAYAPYRYDPIKPTESFDKSVFTEAERILLDNVVRNFGCYSGKILAKFTHLESPWLRTRGELSVGAHSERIIPRQLIGEYFSQVKDKFQMPSPGDIECYSKCLFQRVSK